MVPKAFYDSKGAAKPYVRAEVGLALRGWGREATELGDQWVVVE